MLHVKTSDSHQNFTIGGGLGVSSAYVTRQIHSPSAGTMTHQGDNPCLSGIFSIVNPVQGQNKVNFDVL